ncbi:MAG: MFS transporter [Alphaproteobacteria bacterium]
MSELARHPSPAPRPRATLATCGATHILHDGYSNLLYLLLPIWAQEFQLSLFQVGLLKAAYSGAMGLFQLPAGLLAERVGERILLGIGTALVGLGFLALGFASGFAALVALLAVAGFGSCVQHPLSSALVSRAYESGKRRAALGIYNFSGDLGKIALPGLVGLALAAITWRQAAWACGILGLVSALSIILVLQRLDLGRRPTAEDAANMAATSGWGIRDKAGFRAITMIGIIDNGARAAVLTFLPFLLVGKGASVQTVGLALSLIFAGGAFGKFLCGVLAERLGIVRTIIVTELLTAAAIGVILVSPVITTMILLPVLGVALNGTSSVLYGSVADLVESERLARAFGLFYSFGIGASAVSPALYGILSDASSVSMTLAVIAAMVLTTIPLTRFLRL